MFVSKHRAERIERDVSSLEWSVQQLRYLDGDIADLQKTVAAILNHLGMECVDVDQIPAHRKLVKKK